jgi:hypothetical protein
MKGMRKVVLMFCIGVVCTGSAWGATPKLKTITGCVTARHQHPGEYQFANKTVCMRLKGNLASAAGHLARLRGYVEQVPDGSPVFNVTKIEKVMGPCHLGCVAPTAGAVDPPGCNGATKGLH